GSRTRASVSPSVSVVPTRRQVPVGEFARGACDRERHLLLHHEYSEPPLARSGVYRLDFAAPSPNGNRPDSSTPAAKAHRLSHPPAHNARWNVRPRSTRTYTSGATACHPF